MLQKVSKAEAQCSGPVEWLQLVEKGTSRYQSTAVACVKNTIKCNKKKENVLSRVVMKGETIQRDENTFRTRM